MVRQNTGLVSFRSVGVLDGQRGGYLVAASFGWTDINNIHKK